MGRRRSKNIPEAELAAAVYGGGTQDWAQAFADKYGLSLATVYRQANALKQRALGSAPRQKVIAFRQKKSLEVVGRKGSSVKYLPEAGVGGDQQMEPLGGPGGATGDAEVTATEIMTGRSIEAATRLPRGAKSLDDYLGSPDLLDVIHNLKTSSRISYEALAHLDARIANSKDRGRAISNAELQLYAKLAKEFRDLSKTVYEIEEAVVKLSREAFENIFMKEVLSAIYEADPATGRRIFEAIRSRSALLGAFIEGGPGALLADGPGGTVEAGTGEEPST